MIDHVPYYVLNNIKCERRQFHLKAWTLANMEATPFKMSWYFTIEIENEKTSTLCKNYFLSAYITQHAPYLLEYTRECVQN